MILNVIASAMSEMGLNYAFMEWKDDPAFPFFVGEYQESPAVTEDGLQETTFILTGFSRGTWQELEQAKEKIEKYFNKVSGKAVITEQGSAVAVFYSHSLVVPTEDAELKRLEINLDVKEWKVL